MSVIRKSAVGIRVDAQYGVVENNVVVGYEDGIVVENGFSVHVKGNRVSKAKPEESKVKKFASGVGESIVASALIAPFIG